MTQSLLRQTQNSGCVITGAINPVLGRIGPKHHAVILGQRVSDGQDVIAELMTTGYQLHTLEAFKRRYAKHAQIKIHRFAQGQQARSIVNRALAEINNGSKKRYNLLTNNCECFTNRVVFGQSHSMQVLNTMLAVALLSVVFYAVRQTR